MKKLLLVLFITLCTNLGLQATGWQMLNKDADIRNLVVVDNTWFGIQRTLTGTVLKNLLVSSVDKGQTWQPNSYFNEVYSIIAYENKMIVYGDRPTERGFYLTTDKGIKWKKMVGNFNNGASTALITKDAIFITIQKNPGITSPVYRSTNGGDSFQPMPIDVGTTSFNFGRNFGNMSQFKNKLFVFVGRVGVFSTDDGGNTWKKENDGLDFIEANHSPNGSGVLSQVGPDLFLYLLDTFSVARTFIYKNGAWELYNADVYAYSSIYDTYVKQGTLSPTPTAYREPYIFTVDGAYSNSSGIHYSVDKGKSWYYFDDIVVGAVKWDGIVIDGNYVYAASSLGFCRRPLSEVKNYVVTKPRTDFNKKLPTSPEEFANLLGLIGAEAMEELFAESGADLDAIFNTELKDFLSDYSGGSTGGLFGNSQPGSCSFMGMPSWSANLANMKIFMRDILFRKQGIGPETKLALNYITTASSPTLSAFGAKWKFEYETTLTKRSKSVVLATGTGANFIFSNNAALPTGTTAYTLPCINNSQLQLNWNGTQWLMTKLNNGEKQLFSQLNDSVFVLKEITDAYNNKTIITHTLQGLISNIKDASNRQYIFYNTNGRCDSIATPDGRKARFVYVNNLLISASDFDNVTTKYTYNAAKDISSVNIAGKTTTFEYDYTDDTSGMLSAVVDPENRRIEYSSSFLNDSTTITVANYPGGNIATYTVENGSVTSVTNTLGEEKNIVYNSKGKIDSLVYYDGSSVGFTYDNRNNIIAKKTRDNAQYKYLYDNANNLLQAIILPFDTVFSKTYNAKNQLTSITLPGKRKTQIAYDSKGALSGFTSPDGGNNTYTRDNFGNIKSYTNPLNQTTTIQYDAVGFKPVSRNDFKGNTYGMEYDGNGRLRKINLPDGNSKSISYDCCTQTGMTDENGKTISVIRDATNRILSYHYADGWSYNTTYDSEGYISGFSNKYGMQTQLKYNARGQLTSVSDVSGAVTFEYNDFGNTTKITDKKRNITTFGYNENAKTTEITDALGLKVKFGYDTSNRLTETTNARGQETELVYNKLGLVSEKKILGNAVASYTYNPNGLMTSYTDAAGTTSYVRNAVGFVTKIIYPGNIEVSFTYDANGNLLTTVYPNGLTATNHTDALNRINKISWANQFVDFSYDAAGYMLAETRSNTTSTSYMYNDDHRPTKILHKQNNQPFAGETITIESGIVTGITVQSPITTNTLPQPFSYGTINELNQIVATDDGYTFAYDADGNMTQANKNSTAFLTASYNANNQIKTLQADNQNIQITYDGMHSPRTIVTQGITQKLYYDHKGRLLFETDATGNGANYYIYKGKRLIATQNNQNVSHFYHSSRLGHVVAITSSNGTVVNAYQYNAAGEILGQSGTLPNRFTFLGAFGGIKLTNNFILTGVRVYQPLIGRYIQRDPLGLITGTNPYTYAANNPVNGIDPFGFDKVDATVNSLDFDPPSDNNYGTAAGTANPYADHLPQRSNNWDDYGSAAMDALVDLSNHPISDLLPSGIASPISTLKAIDKLANKEYGSAIWQFVPFNNSLEAVGKYISDEAGKFNPNNVFGVGIIPYNSKQSYSCDL